jgi:putative sigma-54 modulation protein
MKISVTFRNAEGENWQKDYVDDRLKKMKKYIDRPVEAHVVLSVEKFRNVAEVNLMADGLNVNAKEESKDMHLAIDNAIEKIERQLKKRKEKIRGHKTNLTRSEGITAVSGFPEEAEEAVNARVVETRRIVLKPMSLDDAMMEIEESKNLFIMYRDAMTENVSLIYRREDGLYALIEANS